MRRRIVCSLLLGSVLLTSLAWFSQVPLSFGDAPIWGATFSFAYAEDLDIDAKATYTRMLTELPVTRVRLPVDWDRIQPTEGEFVWSEIDWAMDTASAYGAEVILAVGEKTPRWPECHTPLWVTARSEAEHTSARLLFVRAAVERYRDHPALHTWQVENEPFFPYGECPLPDPEALLEERALVASLDPEHPIQLTVSGELEPWTIPASFADTLGFSLYRKTWNPRFGETMYPIGPAFYRWRQLLVAPLVSHVIVSELQAEPWFSVPIAARSAAEWLEVFGPEELRENMTFARETGASEVYLWGVEWWAYLEEAGEPELWEAARDFML